MSPTAPTNSPSASAPPPGDGRTYSTREVPPARGASITSVPPPPPHAKGHHSHWNGFDLPPEADFLLPQILDTIADHRSPDSLPFKSPFAGVPFRTALRRHLEFSGRRFLYPSHDRLIHDYILACIDNVRLGPLAIEVLDKVSRCCSEGAIRRKRDGTLQVLPLWCRQRICPHCQSIRSARLRNEVLRRIPKIPPPPSRGPKEQWKLITLTIPNCSPADLRHALERLRKGFLTLRSRSKSRNAFRAGLWSIEVTYNEDSGTFHPHLHTLALGSFISAGRLSWDWSKAVGGYAAAHVTAVRNQDKSLADGVAEVIKYITKIQDSISQPTFPVNEYIAGLYNQRLFSTYGALYGASDNSTATTEPLNPAAQGPVPDTENASYVCDWNMIIFLAAADYEPARQFLFAIRRHRHQQDIDALQRQGAPP